MKEDRKEKKQNWAQRIFIMLPLTLLASSHYDPNWGTTSLALYMMYRQLPDLPHICFFRVENKMANTVMYTRTTTSWTFLYFQIKI